MSKIVPAQVPETRISKSEIRNKSQIPIPNDKNILNFGHWNLFRISCLGFRVLVEVSVSTAYEPKKQVRPEGFEPPPCRLKVCCATVTPRPRLKAAVCTFMSMSHGDRSPLSRSAQRTLLALSRDGRSRTDDYVVPNHVGYRSPTSRRCCAFQQEHGQHPVSKPGCACSMAFRYRIHYVRSGGFETKLKSAPWGSRTPRLRIESPRSCH